MIFGLLFLTFWIVCGVLEYGFSFAYLQGEFPSIADKGRRQDRIFCLVNALFGPISLISTLTCGWTKHGLKFR